MSINTFLWLDFETTGLDFKFDDIIEVGAVLTDCSMIPVTSFQSLVTPSEEAYFRLMQNDRVRSMHRNTGLLQDLDSLISSSMSSLKSLEFVEHNLLSWLDSSGLDTSTMYLCGSGVSHFDHHLINIRLPRLAERLRYATIDVSVLWRFQEAFVGDSLEMSPVDSSKAHRAMYDVERAVEMGEKYRDFLLDCFAETKQLQPS